jgi:hypothetical protein
MMTTHGRFLARWCTAALLMLAFFPRSAVGITLTLRDLADPVPPGGVLTYTIRVSGSDSGGGEGPPVCFNPPPECITFPATCSIGSPSCVGNSFIGYVCDNAANAGANCGVGDPPIPNVALCVPKTTGTCNGGSAAGLPCTSGGDCPGNTFVCQHSFNNGDFCGTGNPLHADSTFCLNNPTGTCSGGPNLGLPCTAPHNSITDECPSDDGDPGINGIVVTLPIPTETSFLDADNGATSDGETITWTLSGLEPCGSAGLPQCPLLTARLLVDPVTPVGTVIVNTASVTGLGGSAQSSSPKTTVGTFRLQRFAIAKARNQGRDSFIYRALFMLSAAAEIDPPNEPFGIKVETTSGQQLLDLQLSPGSLLPFSRTGFRFMGVEPGLRRLVLRETSPSQYRLNVNARRLNLDIPEGLQLIVTLTLGDDVMSHPVSLLVMRAGRKYVGINGTH